MSKCVINSGVSTITRDGNLWVVDGKYKVSDLSTCKVITSQAAATPEAPAPSEPVAVAPPVVHQAPVVQHPPAVHTETQQLDPSSAELTQLLRLAGDNAWLVAAALLFVFGKQYLEKMEKMKMADTRTKDDLTKECTGRHSEAMNKASEMTGKVEALVTKLEALSGRIDSISTKIESVPSRIEAGKTDSVNQAKALGDALEKRLLALEMEVKYQSKPSSSSVGRPKKSTTDEN